MMLANYDLYFSFLLALALGKTIKEIDEMGGDEFESWKTFYQLNPFDGTRGDLQASIIASTLANVWGNHTKASDFLPDFTPPTKLSEEELAEKINRMFKGN